MFFIHGVSKYHVCVWETCLVISSITGNVTYSLYVCVVLEFHKAGVLSSAFCILDLAISFTI